MRNILVSFTRANRYDTYTDPNLNWHLVGTNDGVYHDVGDMVGIVYQSISQFDSNISDILLHARILVEYIITNNIEGANDYMCSIREEIYDGLAIVYGYDSFAYKEIEHYVCSDIFLNVLQYTSCKIEQGYKFDSWLSATSNIILVERVIHDYGI